jgi:CHASE1-domain containing sensor protein
MKMADRSVRRLSADPMRMATLVTLAGLAIATTLVGWQVRQNGQLAETVFLRQSDHLLNLLHLRIAGYEHGLRGLRGIFVTQPDATRADFAAYAASRDTAREFPGAMGMGFVRRVPHADEEDFVRRRRAELGDDYAIRRQDDNPGDAMIIDYYGPAPADGASIGIDIGANRELRAAALRSMATGMATLSVPPAIGNPDGNGIGQAYLLPIYRRDLPTDTPEQRSAALFGWSMLTLDTPAILAELVDDRLDLALFDAAGDQAPQLIFDTDRHLAAGYSLPMAEASHRARGLTQRYDLELGNRAWHMLKATAGLRDTPVVAVTANAMPRDLERGRQAGFAAYLTKPIDVGSFLRTIDAQLAPAQKARP